VLSNTGSLRIILDFGKAGGPLGSAGCSVVNHVKHFLSLEGV
jgi:hypothetical protein